MTHPRQGQTVETAPAESVVTGPAEILSNVDGDQVQRFAIRIDRVDADAKNGRNLLITVTDEALLAKTGGIVQGMSGSPILQTDGWSAQSRTCSSIARRRAMAFSSTECCKPQRDKS